jgi:hypothetical protein
MCYLAVSSANIALRVEGLTLLEVVLRTLAHARDPDMCEDEDEGGTPSLLDQCQAQIASILRVALDKDNSSPVLLSACVLLYQYSKYVCTSKARRRSYKGTNTDKELRRCRHSPSARVMCATSCWRERCTQVLSLLAFLVHKHKY